MVEQLVQVIRGLDATVILVSQAILPALACCDRLAVFHHGHVAAIGPTEAIARDREMLKACGLDFHFLAVNALEHAGLGRAEHGDSPQQPAKNLLQPGQC